MPKSCLVDSGPLAALLDPREEHHVWARETLSHQPLPWLTCDSVLSEAFFLLRRPHALALEQLLRRGHLRLAFNLTDELLAVLELVPCPYAEPIAVSVVSTSMSLRVSGPRT